MSVPVTLTVYVVLILLGSLAGGLLPHFVRLSHTRMQLMLSFVAGLMLGVGVFHLWVHALESISPDEAAFWLMTGLLTLFFLQRVFSFHTHDVPEDALGAEEGHGHAHDHDHDHSHDHDHDHDPVQGHAHAHDHGHGHAHGPQFGWTGVALGLSIHTIIDGTALAASVAADSAAGHAPTFGLFGFGTFLVVMLHKPFDALSIAALMSRGGWKPAARNVVNGLFAMMIPVGIGLFWLGQSQLSLNQSQFVGCTLAFAAGNFLCIALADLLPELQFHHHDRFKLSASLLAGVAMAYALVFLESGGHDHHKHKPAENHGHEHGHDH